MPVAAGLYYTLYEGGSHLKKSVVLIHGAGSSSRIWPAELRRLPGCTVYALDLPGHGRSAGAGSQSVGAYLTALIDFIAELGLYHAYFAGHDLGGAIALQLALDFPEHVFGIACLASGAFFNVSKDLLAMLSAPTGTLAGQHWLQQRLSARKALPESIRQMFSLHAAARTSVLYNDWLACDRFNLRSRLAQIYSPAYIACGAEDLLTPPALSRHLASGLPHAQLEIYPQCGHLLPLEQPVRLAAALSAFIDTTSAVNEELGLLSLFKKKEAENAPPNGDQNGITNGK